uniref:Uncharacterized protein n=1 Tax=viral metagenome TaxID=1070528 RepID=A0A6C0IBQ0_9ZZZZ
MRLGFLITGLLLLLASNFLLISGYGANGGYGRPTREGFANYFMENAGGAKDAYKSMGAFDGVKLNPANGVSAWRNTAPNEALMNGAKDFAPGPDNLFMFKDNQCKPECCGSSFSCGGGCVCTTPQQRQFIASRGGNRTAPDDGA